MDVAQKRLKPGPLNFSQLYIILFSISFENLKLLVLKLFDLWPFKGQKFSLKMGAFDTLVFLFILAISLSKSYEK